jgi:hypothetical protein
MKRKPYVSRSDAEQRARAAQAELEAHEYCAPRGPYFRLSSLAIDTDTAGRIAIAAAAYRVGGRELRGSRAHDNCFEMGDGDAVVAALVRMADVDAVLHAAIAADFGGTFPASWRDTERQAKRLADRQRQEIELRLRSPMRPGAVDAKDAAHLPLFVAANEPRLAL